MSPGFGAKSTPKDQKAANKHQLFVVFWCLLGAFLAFRGDLAPNLGDFSHHRNLDDPSKATNDCSTIAYLLLSVFVAFLG